MLVNHILRQLDLPQPIAIIGAGVTGVSFYELLEQSNIVFDVLTESNNTHIFFKDKLNQLTIGELTDEKLSNYQTLLVSPGIDLRRDCFKNMADKIVSDIELFARLINKMKVASDASTQLIGITASNGKSTVADMLHHVSTYTDDNYVLCGNIGVAVLSALLTHQMDCDGYIIELSSYHLDSTPSLVLDFGVWLNVSPDHLDRYNSYNDYVMSKSRIFDQSMCAIGNADDQQVTYYARQHNNYELFSLQANSASWVIHDGIVYLNDQKLCDFNQFNETGYHIANKLAVFVVAYRLGFTPESIVKGYETYQSLPSRFITIGEKKGVTFINDSKATNVGSVIAAIECIESPIVLIVGGVAKGQDFSPLLKVAENKVKYVVLIGQDAEDIAQALGKKLNYKQAGSLNEAFYDCLDVAEPGDTVLLSPACASQDMFVNYLERGSLFEQLVKEHMDD